MNWADMIHPPGVGEENSSVTGTFDTDLMGRIKDKNTSTCPFPLSLFVFVSQEDNT